MYRLHHLVNPSHLWRKQTNDVFIATLHSYYYFYYYYEEVEEEVDDKVSSGSHGSDCGDILIDIYDVYWWKRGSNCPGNFMALHGGDRWQVARAI